MGTNYYINLDSCEHCGRFSEQIHIGKSSGGWCFSLHVHFELNIKDLYDWTEYWKDKEIVSEYETKLTSDEMLDIITNREWEGEADYSNDPYYSSEEDFHNKNNSEKGPNGLLRHKIGSHCIAHGHGTWDLIKGDFC